MTQRDDTKRRVQEATDIVALIQQHVHLKARGREFVGLCPFHDDKNPSMNVIPAKQMYYCFSCGAGGDCITFVMNYHKMSFIEALKFLAERANITLPRYDGGGGGDSGPSPRQRIMAVNAQAQEFFRSMLRHEQLGAAAREYIAQRGISDEMVSVFQLGAAPDEWDSLARQVAAKRWDLQGFEQAGLVAKRSSGDGYYDKLRHRLIFPIFDNIGRPIAFGGRIMLGTKREDKPEPKYLNSPETPAFNKSSTLYGLHAAQKPIVDCRTAVIVEGYVDVIACHQNGFKNVVATLGTAMTAEHAVLLRRFCDKVILVFDADDAGLRAADRAVAVLFTEPLDVSIAVVPDGKDPADLFANPQGRELWVKALDQATDALQFQFERVRRQYDAVDTVTGRQRIAEEYLQKLVQLGVNQVNPQRKGLLFAQVGHLLKMTPGAVQDQVRKMALSAPRQGEPPSDGPPVAVPEKSSPAERQLVGAILNMPELFDTPLPDGRPVSESLVSGDFADLRVRAVFDALSGWLHDHGDLVRADFRDAFGDESLLRMAMELQLEASRLTDDHPERLRSLAAGAAGAIFREKAETEYRRQKVEIGEDAANDISPHEQAMRRLELAVAHANAQPNARRTPRVVGNK